MNTELTICWSITAVCNLNCSYCFSLYENKVQTHMSDYLVKYTLNKLKEKSKENSIRLVILGGEPTLYPNINDVCEEALNFCRKVILVTNGTQLDILKKINRNVSIDFSYHGQNLDWFIKRIKEIQKYHYVQVLCVLDKTVLNNCIKLSDWCNENCTYFEPIPLVNNITEIAEEYDENILKSFKNNILYNIPEIGIKDSISIYKYFKNYNKNDKLKVCNQTNIAIYSNGYVYPCCKTGQIKYKRHIEDPKSLQYKIICEHQYCMKNRGCLDFAGWRQDPNGFLPWSNK